MPKVTTKRRQETLQDDIPSILERFPIGGTAQPAQQDQNKTKELSIADLQRQLAEVNKRLDETSRANAALMAQPVIQPTQVHTPKAVEVDTTGLPDPVTDTENYNKELAKRTMAAMKAQADAEREAERARSSAQADFDRRADALWEDFQKAHPDMAKYERRVRFLAEDIARSAAARGVDVEKYMFGPGRTQFMRDVAEAYEKEWPTTEGDDDGTDDDRGAGGADTARSAAKAAEADRTVGIFGGAESGGKPNQGAAAPQGPAKGTLQRDLSDMQRASGYF